MFYNADTQKLIDIFEQTRTARNWARIRCKDGKVLEAYADCFTYETVGDDEDVDALLLELRDGTNCIIIGDDVESFEILEAR